MLRWRQLRTKLLALFLTLLFIPLLGIGLFSQYFLTSTCQQTSTDIEQQNLNTQAAHVYATFVQTQNALLFLSQLRAFEVMANSSPETDLYQASLQVLRSDVPSFLQVHPQFYQIAFFNVIGEPVLHIESTADGPQIVNTSASDPLLSFAAQVLTAREETTHLGVDNNNGTTTQTLFAYRSAYGAVLISLRSDSLFQINDQLIATRGTWSLQLPTQTLLHYTPQGTPAQQPRLTDDATWQTNENGFFISGESHVFYRQVEVPTHRDRFTLVLFHTVPSQAIMVDLLPYYQTISVIGVGAFMWVFALALFSITRFVEPIQQLKGSVDAFRKTQTLPSLTDLPPDEIGDLSLAFYTMATELHAKRQSEQELVEKLITAQEEERKRVAYELHDGLIQLLVGTRFSLNKCLANLPDSIPGEDRETFEYGYEQLSVAIVEGRRIMQGLHPNILDDLGLVEALKELATTMGRQYGWRVDVGLDKLNEEPEKIMSVTLYRIAQEALNNAGKHAGATEVSVRLWQDDGVHLVVADDGRGFDSQASNGTGWGLRTMQERVHLLHGTIAIDSSATSGTTITVWIPESER